MAEEVNAVTTRPEASVAVPVDMMNARSFEQMQMVANVYAQSSVVPDLFRNNKANCCVALELSCAWNIPVLAVMQGLYLVKGKIAVDSKVAIALINSSGKFDGDLEYEID